MNKSQRKFLFISIAISLTVLFAVLILTINENTLSALNSCIPGFLILSLSMHIVSLLFWALRIKLMSRSLGYKISTRYCFNLVCSNMFIAAVTPSSIGGEPVRIYEINKAGVPGGEATAIVTMERVLDGIILAIGTIVCMVLLGTCFSNVQIPEGCLITAHIAAGIFGGLVILFFIVVKHPSWGQKVIQKITSFIFRKKDKETKLKKQNQFTEYVDKFYSTIHFMKKKGKHGIIWAGLFSLFYWANEFIIAFFICWGLGIQPTAELFLLSIIMQLLVTVILMVPITPGGAGIAEISLSAFYALILPANIVGIFVLIYRFIFYYFNLLIGFIASMIIVRRETKYKNPI